jgi:hypothetical protein
MKYKKGDIVIIGFSFSDLSRIKKRLALIISNNSVNNTGDYLMVQVTSKIRNDSLSDIGEVPFSRATLFNFQNRIPDYQQQTGLNLIEQVFDNLSARQIKDLPLKADIQRSDSSLVYSNIKKYSRLQF